MTTPLRLAAALTLAVLAGEARAADVFSPGDLAHAHAALSGLENCTKCHPAGQQLSQARCLECHKELAPRVAAGRGFHGRMPEKDRDCWSCHHEHQGKDAALVDWGPKGEKGFDHAKTGVALAGKHATAACASCHDPKLVKDPAISALLAEQKGRRSFLGAPALTACASCHFDEHRGQLGQDCRRCHTESGWKPAPGFDHARSGFALTGKHAATACAKCHAREEGPAAAPGVLTAPVSATAFTRYKPVAHTACTDCHRDVHEGRFGNACARCHGTEDWKRVAEGGFATSGERSFHQRTRYPLQGAHLTVACAACHGPFPGQAVRYRGLAFGACTDCHADGHEGQLARRGAAEAACDRCHDVNGFDAPRFGLEEHARTAYPLQGAHRVVACASCHRKDPGIAERFAARWATEHPGHKMKFSAVVLAVGGDLGRCETCHADPHAGQLLRPQGCAACHGVAAYRPARFDHAKESRFPLEGKHAQVACASCHREERIALASGGSERAVRYRPLPVACAGCHADPHAGQLGDACSRCHTATRTWKQVSFRHEPPFTDYALTGKHAAVACERCHAEVKLPGGVSVRRYKPLPRACEACHADFHHGAFSGFEPERLTR